MSYISSTKEVVAVTHEDFRIKLMKNAQKIIISDTEECISLDTTIADLITIRDALNIVIDVNLIGHEPEIGSTGISLKNYILHHLSEREAFGDFEIATETVRAIIDLWSSK